MKPLVKEDYINIPIYVNTRCAILKVLTKKEFKDIIEKKEKPND